MSATAASRAPEIRVARFSAWMRPMRPQPMTAMFKVRFFMRILQSELAEKLAVMLRVLFGRAHARQHILFNDNPAAVIGAAQFVNYGWEIHIPLAKFAKNTVLQRSEIIPFFSTRTLTKSRAAIFEMDVPDAITVLT